MQLLTKSCPYLNILQKMWLWVIFEGYTSQHNGCKNRFLFESNLGSLYWYPVLRLHRRACLSQSSRNLVWNIKCTKLPVSEIITFYHNLLLFWKRTISTCHRRLHSIVLWFLFPLKIDFKINTKQRKETLWHKTGTKCNYVDEIEP